MQLFKYAAVAALLLQMPSLVMAADVTAETMQSSTASSLACASGLKSATTGYDAAKASDKLKQALLIGTGLDQLAADDRSFYSGLQTTSAACAVAHTAHRALLNDLAALLETGKAPPSGFKAEFDKMEAAFKAANAAMAEASKVAVFAHVINRAGSTK